MSTKPIVWIDMDGVLVDLEAHILHLQSFYPGWVDAKPDSTHGIFRYAPMLNGAKEAINILKDHFDLYIATAAPWRNPESAADKLCWLQHHFGSLFVKKVCITHCKHMLLGEYLIDDRLANGAAEFQGKHIHFGHAPFQGWKEVVEYLLKKHT